MSISILAYMPFIAAQFYPKFYTMIPAGLSVGLGGGPLWCAKCTYLTIAAEAYSSISDIAADVLVTRFFGLFFMFYQMAQVWGNLISSAGESLPRQTRSSLYFRKWVCWKKYLRILLILFFEPVRSFFGKNSNLTEFIPMTVMFKRYKNGS